MVRVRIGPSPTGDPHVGTAYIALFNYIFAKQQGGQFILRIEDTDRQRSNPAWETMIIDALSWLGLAWDEGPDIGGPHQPYRQSERGAIYQEHATLLLANQRAYPCFCTSERLEALRLLQRQRNMPSGYDGNCRRLSQQDKELKLAAKTPHVVRLKVPQSSQRSHITVDDILRGPIQFAIEQIDDQVLLKSDGMPTYHLANVVDDHLMQITHVIRAEEWLTSTPKHLLLYEAFGWTPPQWAHMPLLRNQDKSKISKRKNPISLNYYRQAGFLPEAMCNYLAMMGWTMPDGREQFLTNDLIQHFTFDRISLGGPVFDIQKLSWLNTQYLRALTAAEIDSRYHRDIVAPTHWQQVLALVSERLQKLEDIAEATSYFFSGDLVLDPALLTALLPKGRKASEIIRCLEDLSQWIDTQIELEPTMLEQYIRMMCTTYQLKTKELFMPVRVACTGRTVTPPLFNTLALLGKERCRRRLRQVSTWLTALLQSGSIS